MMPIERRGPTFTTESGDVGARKIQIEPFDPTGSELGAVIMLEFHFALTIGEVGKVGDRDVAFEK